jgi:hypothetical protein
MARLRNLRQGALMLSLAALLVAAPRTLAGS